MLGGLREGAGEDGVEALELGTQGRDLRGDVIQVRGEDLVDVLALEERAAGEELEGRARERVEVGGGGRLRAVRVALARAAL